MFEEIIEYVKKKQYMQARKELIELNAPDVAAILEELSGEDMLKVFRMLPKDMAAEVFSHLPLEEEQDLITSLATNEAASILDNLFADDAADLIDEMPAGVVTRLLEATSPETRRDINHLLKYPEDSAGSVMTVEYVSLKENITVEQAFDRIRTVGVDKETIDICYVTDLNRQLLGTVTLRRLLLSDKSAKISDIMHENVITINTLTDQEEAAREFKKYDFTSMPVVDSENRLVGIITVDDIVDIMEQEATEDIEKMAAIIPTDKPYMKTGIFETYRKRMPWLLLLMISATFTGSIISHYESALGAYVVLTSFIPMLMDTGGNAGSQASITIIRGLSLNEITMKDLFRVLWKEIRIAIGCGLTLAAANLIRLLLFDRVGIAVAAVVCLTLFVVVIVAKITGSVLPLLAKQIGFDPAVMATPFITTIVDAMSLLLYFQIATHILHI
ncbi:MAG: magnesium transporter [Lachnospiraceae bacterium]|nr:magnesium transporter [Lachnospiraceae bacterium]